MGIFDFFKRQLLKVIELEEMPSDTLVMKYQLEDRDEIMNSSSLVVRPGQVAVFVHKGEICDVFAEGTYKLATENVPILTKVLSLPTGFDSPIKADVYYVNVKQIAGLKWGTQNPVMLRDKDFGTVRVRGFGVYAFRIDDVKKFIRDMSGTNTFRVQDVEVHIKPMLLEALTDTIAESKISALDLATNYREFSSIVLDNAKKTMTQFGVEITSMVIENISVPEEVEKALDERTKLGILKDEMNTFTQYQAAQAIRDAAQNEGGGNLTGLGVGLGAGTTLGSMFAQTMANQTMQANSSSDKNEVKDGSIEFENVCFKYFEKALAYHWASLPSSPATKRLPLRPVEPSNTQAQFSP